MSRIDATFDALRARRAHGADSVRHRRRSVARSRRPPIMHALVDGRRRRHRARRAVLRSDGRRPGDPARVRARAGAGRRPARRARHRRDVPPARHATTPVVLMGYANPIEAMGVRSVRRRAHATPASTACSSSTIRPRKRRSSRHCSRKRATSTRSSCSRRPRPRRASSASRSSPRGYVYYVSLKGVTGAGHLDTADVGAQARRDPPPRHAAGRRRLRHPRRRQRAGDRRTCRRGRHRQPHHQGDRARAARAKPRRAPVRSSRRFAARSMRASCSRRSAVDAAA